MNQATVIPIDTPHARATKLHCALDDDVENRLHIRWRSSDNLEDFGSRSLPLQRFIRLVEQPNILNCDYGLIGEDGDKFNLLVRERPQRSTYQHQRTDSLTFTQQRHPKKRVGISE